MYRLIEQLDYIRKKINKDNYANKNFEVACTYIKMIELLMRDKEIGEDNYYEISMCQEKSPNLDSYIICTTKKHNDYGIQVKSGNIYDTTVKERIYFSQDKYPINPNHYILLTWNKFKTYNSFHSLEDVQDESILDVLDYIEDKKDNYKQECCFLFECLNTIVKYTKWHTEVNWIVLSRLQSELLNKKNCENYSYSFAC